MVQLIKRGMKALARTEIMSRLVARLEATSETRSNLLRVLTYHRVDCPDASAHLYPGTLSATPDDFRWQMEYLANRYCFVGIHDVLAAIRGHHELPPKSLLITFDDAYEDFAEHAWPTLRELSLPAVLFVPTSFPGNPNAAFWWDRLHQAARDAHALETQTDLRRFRDLIRHVKELPHADGLAFVDAYCRERGTCATRNYVMTWDKLRELANEGLALAAHTRTHPLMTRISIEQAVEEATRSREDISRETGIDLPVFAYPAGACSKALVEPLGNAGFEAAFTTNAGINDLRYANALLLKRINVSLNTPRTAVRAQLVSGLQHLMPLFRFASPRV